MAACSQHQGQNTTCKLGVSATPTDLVHIFVHMYDLGKFAVKWPGSLVHWEVDAYTSCTFQRRAMYTRNRHAPRITTNNFSGTQDARTASSRTRDKLPLSPLLLLHETSNLRVSFRECFAGFREHCIHACSVCRNCTSTNWFARCDRNVLTCPAASDQETLHRWRASSLYP
jgi:hypothetical protein